MGRREASGVSEWRDETAADLADARRRIVSLLESVAG